MSTIRFCDCIVVTLCIAVLFSIIVVIVMAGFPNPLPDTLHLFLVGFSVYTCVFGRAYATSPGRAYLC